MCLSSYTGFITHQKLGVSVRRRNVQWQYRYVMEYDICMLANDELGDIVLCFLPPQKSHLECQWTNSEVRRDGAVHCGYEIDQDLEEAITRSVGLFLPQSLTSFGGGGGREVRALRWFTFLCVESGEWGKEGSRRRGGREERKGREGGEEDEEKRSPSMII